MRDLDGCYLRVLCPASANCSKVSEVSIKNLAQRYGGEVTLAELLPRMRCTICRSRAGQVELHGPRVTIRGSYAPAESCWQVLLARE